jgi:hypothetical protein
MSALPFRLLSADKRLRFRVIGMFMLFSAFLSGCPLTPTKPDQPVGSCDCACGREHAGKPAATCSADPLDEPASSSKSSSPH